MQKLSSEHATWDILRRFAALSEEETAELDANIDFIRNGLTLNMCLHSFSTASIGRYALMQAFHLLYFPYTYIPMLVG